MEDLTVFDAKLPRAACESQAYNDNEWESLCNYTGPDHSPDQHPDVRGRYRRLVPFEDTFYTRGLTSRRVAGDFAFRSDEVLLVTSAADNRRFKIDTHDHGWPR